MSNKQYLIDNKELMKEWNYEKNKKLNINPQNITTGSSKKVWWKCESGHEWEAVIHTRAKGTRCPYCIGKKAIAGENDLVTTYPELAKEWDYEKNKLNHYDIDTITLGSIKKVWWICNKGHSYQRSIYDRLHSRGNCPYCSNRKLLVGFNDLATTNPELLAEWDYEKNDKFNVYPTNITNGTRTKIWWKCKKGHVWDSIARSRINGHGCPYCSNNKVLKGYNDLTTTNPEIIHLWNEDKNKNLKPEMFSHGSTKKVWWKCENGHEWEAKISEISLGNRCPICSNQRILKGYNDFATKHPELLKEWDYEKNDKLGLKPNEIILGGKNKIWWKCDKGHEWQTTIAARIRNNHLYNRCPICSSYLRTSIPEKIIYYYLLKTYPRTKANYKPEWLKPKELDIFIPEKNIAIEYDGSYYHKNKTHDIEKDILCEKNGIALIRIREQGLPKINTNSIIYEIPEKNNTSYLYINYALKFLEQYLNINLNFNITKDFDNIMKLINFMEKENCISNTNPEVLKEWNYEKNNLIGVTPENITNGSALKIWWKCEKGHDYMATISTKINQNTGCPYCSNKKILRGFNDFATKYPELLKEWDYEKNKINPYEITYGSVRKVWWLCPKGHSYNSTILNRLKNCNCPICSGHQVLPGYNDIATLFPNLLKEWNYKKNNELGLDPTLLGKGYDKKVWWICDKGHEWFVSINSRTSHNTKCPYCSGTKVLTGYNDVYSLKFEFLKEWDYEKNKNVNLKEIGKGNRTKFWWKCNKNHNYIASIPNRIKGTGCPYCSGNKVLKGYNDIATTHPEILKNWNYEKNAENGIFPYNISKSYSKKVWWKCDKGHNYQREVYNQRNGYGKCPVCKKDDKRH